MTPFQLITDAVSPLKAYADHNPKKESEYVVFNIADDRGTVHGDDQPTQRVMAVQVHYYAPHGTNYLTTMTNIRNRLAANGFTYPVVQVLYETDTNSHHLIFECEIELEA